jgi:hypothetical protein
MANYREKVKFPDKKLCKYRANTPFSGKIFNISLYTMNLTMNYGSMPSRLYRQV